MYVGFFLAFKGLISEVSSCSFVIHVEAVFKYLPLAITVVECFLGKGKAFLLQAWTGAWGFRR
jgi:hypothetical protein